MQSLLVYTTNFVRLHHLLVIAKNRENPVTPKHEKLTQKMEYENGEWTVATS